MKEITASVTGQNLVLEQTVLNVAGSVNMYKLKIDFDEDWENIDTKIVSFANGCGKAIGVEYNNDDGITIPWEVLKAPEGQIGKVHIGVLGYQGTTLRITTTAAYEGNVLIVMPASLGLEAAMTPTPDIYQKLLQAIAAQDVRMGQLANLDTDDKTNLVAAINEVLSKISQGGGTVKSVNNIGPDDNGNVAISIPTKTSELENNSNFQNSTQTAATANAAVATHNASNSAHPDIREAVNGNTSDIATINGKIPAQASASNQLADKGFVNSSIQTSTAHFRGNWGTWADVPTNAADYPVDDDGNHEPTSNDYMVIQDAADYPVEQGEDALEGTWRFKYSGVWATNGKNGWHPEYQVNETPLTAAQLAALNSGATAALMEKLTGIPADAEANTIDSISVNGTAVTPDANKNVDILIPDGVLLLDVDNHTLTADELQAFKDAWDSRGPIFIHYGAIGGQIVHSQSGNTLDWTQPQTFSAIMGVGIQTGYGDKWNPRFQGAQVTFTPSKMKLNLSWNGNSTLAMEGDSSLSTTTGGNGWVKKSAIKEALALKQNTLTFDTTPTEDSTNPVTSGGVFDALADAGDIRTLTNDDYNYPTTGTKTAIALWLLEPGIYRIKPGDAFAAVTIRKWDGGNSTINSVSRSQSFSKTGSAFTEAIVVVNSVNAGGNAVLRGYMIVTLGNIGTESIGGVYVETGQLYGNTSYYPCKMLANNDIVDNLTSGSSYAQTLPLSAYQGFVLNNKIVGTTETTTIATTDWTALTGSDPYDYSATITATTTINANTGVVELINDQPALFATHGFAIGAVSGQSVTIYSIGQPDASVSLKLNIRNL